MGLLRRLVRSTSAAGSAGAALQASPVAWRVAQGHIDAAEDEGVRHWQSERYAASEHANKRANHAPFSLHSRGKKAGASWRRRSGSLRRTFWRHLALTRRHRCDITFVTGRCRRHRVEVEQLRRAHSDRFALSDAYSEAAAYAASLCPTIPPAVPPTCVPCCLPTELPC
jgi:hypothetical protein